MKAKEDGLSAMSRRTANSMRLCVVEIAPGAVVVVPGTVVVVVVVSGGVAGMRNSGWPFWSGT